MIDLEIVPELNRKARRGVVAKIRKSKPFLINKMAKLVHRPRSINVHNRALGGYHYAIRVYCGASFTGRKKFTFVDDLDSNQIVCARCEEFASIKHGTSSEICGKHIHIGGVKAYAKCCDLTQTNSEVK